MQAVALGMFTDHSECFGWMAGVFILQKHQMSHNRTAKLAAKCGTCRTMTLMLHGHWTYMLCSSLSYCMACAMLRSISVCCVNVMTRIRKLLSST